MRHLAILCACLALTGCVTTQDDATLRPYAVAANRYVGEHFRTMLTDAQLARIHLIWGTRSEWIAGYAPRISIRRDLQDDPAGAQLHMNHEVFHAVSELSDNPARYKGGVVPQYLNGVRIADWVAWRTP